MADVGTTGMVAVGTGAGLIILQYLVHPVWPPPEPVLTIAATGLAPAAHLLGKALMGRLFWFASKIDPTDDPPTPSVVVDAPAVPIAPAPPAPPAMPATPSLQQHPLAPQIPAAAANG